MDAQPKLDELLNQERKAETAAKASLVEINREIEIRQAKIKFYNDQVAKAQERTEQKMAALEVGIADLQDQHSRDQESLKVLHGQLQQTSDKIDKKAKALADIEAQIQERKAYFDNQERQIETATEAWSDRMREMTGTFNQIKQDQVELLEQITQLHRQIEELNNAKILLVIETDACQDKLDEADKLYKTAVEKYKVRLKELQDQLKKLIDDNVQEANKYTKRQEELDYREKHIEVKEELLKKATIELDLKRRRLNSDLSVRGVQ